jgi:hypothetical protein
MSKSLFEANQERLNHKATYQDFPIGTKVKVVCLYQDMYFFYPDKENTNGIVIKNKSLEKNRPYLGITVKWDEPRHYEDGYIQYDFNFEPHDLIVIEDKEVAEWEEDYTKDVTYLDAKIKKLQAENSMLKECVEFYAEIFNWRDSGQDYGLGTIRPDDKEDLSEDDRVRLFGGKHARQCLQELEK